MKWFVHAIKNYANFNGRARRQEYWMYTLVCIIISTVCGFVDSILGMSLLSGIFSLFTLIPSLSIGVRRLHDIEKSGWWLLLAAIPVVNFLLLYFLVKPGSVGANKYGADPKGYVVE